MAVGEVGEAAPGAPFGLPQQQDNAASPPPLPRTQSCDATTCRLVPSAFVV